MGRKREREKVVKDSFVNQLKVDGRLSSISRHSVHNHLTFLSLFVPPYLQAIRPCHHLFDHRATFGTFDDLPIFLVPFNQSRIRSFYFP